MDLSKAFDTINHSLRLEKLNAYGFSNQALSFYKVTFATDFRET